LFMQGLTLGDFNGDGLSEMAITDQVYNPQTFVYEGMLEVYALNTPFVAANTGWPMTFHDPQNSSTADPLQAIIDTTPPTVSLVTPANGDTLTGQITVSGTAADDVGVASVQILADGLALGLASGTTSWTYLLDSAQLSNSTHTLTALAK